MDLSSKCSLPHFGPSKAFNYDIQLTPETRVQLWHRTADERGSRSLIEISQTLTPPSHPDHPFEEPLEF